jgi:hypothetical protein
MRQVIHMLLLVLAGPALVAASAPEPAITAQDRHDLRCAAAFAVVATLQVRGDQAALALPPLGLRGKRYLGLVGDHLAMQAGLTDAALRDLLEQAARSAGHDGATDIAQSCMADLDSAVPPRPAPEAPACLAMLDIYAQVLAARDRDNPLAARLAREAAGLDAAAQAVLQARGLDAAARTAAIERERERVREALDGGPATLDADDFAQCRRLAAAPPR